MRYRLLGIAGLAVSLTLTGLALAAQHKDTYKLKATLKARSEVPKPTRVPKRAAGTFTGTAVEQSSNRARLTWRLTFSHLSGRATAAHVHIGRPGKAGNVLVPLCAPCKSGQRGSATITHAQLKTIESGGTYVNVHTVRNAAGEIRGQVKTSGGSTTASSSPPPPPTTTEPPPYPYP
jgi:hypothetical protein